MKRDLVLNFLYLFAFFALTVVLKNWFDIPVIIQLVVGGVVGTFLPYIDYLIYAYAIKTNAPVTVESINKKNILDTIKQYSADNSIKGDLVFHTALFQALLMIFVFFVTSSSGSVFARGIVLAFSLHLILNQVLDFQRDKNIDSWFIKFPLELDAFQKKIFMFANPVLLVLIGLLT